MEMAGNTAATTAQLRRSAADRADTAAKAGDQALPRGESLSANTHLSVRNNSYDRIFDHVRWRWVLNDRVALGYQMRVEFLVATWFREPEAEDGHAADSLLSRNGRLGEMGTLPMGGGPEEGKDHPTLHLVKNAVEMLEWLKQNDLYHEPVR
jgi:hypothetical protein